MHPEITMTCSPMALVLDAWERGDNKELRSFFMADARKLAASGCDFFVCPDNTAHIAWNRPASPIRFPRCTLARSSPNRRCETGGPGRILDEIYDDRAGLSGAFGRRGIEWAFPDEADRDIVDDIIFNELCLGDFRDNRATPMCGSSTS